MVIQVTPKVWRPKMKNRYIPPDYANDIDEGIFIFVGTGRQYTDPKNVGRMES